MRIAHIVQVMNTVPPAKYGGIEEVVYRLALGQAAAGNEVTVFAAKGSKIPGKGIRIRESSPYPTKDNFLENRQWEISEFLQIIAAQGDFDICHFHYEPIIARAFIDDIQYNFINFLKKPAVFTFHNITNIESNIAYYRKNKSLWRHNFVFISNKQRLPLKFLPKSEVIYNGIPVELFSFNAKPKDYLLFIGRITKVKGIVEAIRCAKKAGKKLIIAAKIDPVDRDFYEQKVKPLIDGEQIIYVGEVNFKQKINLYKDALCTLFPVSWEEPFGLVIVESLACGTPVIAFNRGSVPEIMQDGKTGFIVNNVAEMVKAVAKIDQIKRSYCRDYVEAHFTSDKMVVAYLSLYREIITNQ